MSLGLCHLETSRKLPVEQPWHGIDHGGLKQLDAVLGNHLDEVREALDDPLWEAS